MGAREDFLDLFGTVNSDAFNVIGAAGTVQIVHAAVTGGSVTTVLNTPAITGLSLRGLEGDDVFNLSGTLPYANSAIDAGDPAASDVVNLTGATGPVAVSLTRRVVACPHCGSGDTEEIARFGSTACKALRRCRACLEPFDEFKTL